MKKKDIPLELLEFLDKISIEYKNILTIKRVNNNLFYLTEKRDLDSPFFFSINQYSVINGKLSIDASRRPTNNISTETVHLTGEISEIAIFFKNWINIVTRYRRVSIDFEDPIIKSYEEEFFSNFEIVDNDADSCPFSIDKILYLDNYLDDVNQRLTKYIGDGNTEEIQDIQQNIEDLRSNLTNQPKKDIIRKLSKIWAKIAKLGVPFIKEFIETGRKEIYKIVVRAAIETGKGIADGTIHL